jgi:hypothetical protein
MYLIDMYQSFMQIYRFNPTTDGKVAIPSAMFFGTVLKDGKVEAGRRINRRNKRIGSGGIATATVPLIRVSITSEIQMIIPILGMVGR